jgi:hypothetical protein
MSHVSLRSMAAVFAQQLKKIPQLSNLSSLSARLATSLPTPSQPMLAYMKADPRASTKLSCWPNCCHPAADWPAPAVQAVVATTAKTAAVKVLSFSAPPSYCSAWKSIQCKDNVAYISVYLYSKVGTQSDIQEELYRTEHDIGTSRYWTEQCGVRHFVRYRFEIFIDTWYPNTWVFEKVPPGLELFKHLCVSASMFIVSFPDNDHVNVHVYVYCVHARVHFHFRVSLLQYYVVQISD